MGKYSNLKSTRLVVQKNVPAPVQYDNWNTGMAKLTTPSIFSWISTMNTDKFVIVTSICVKNKHVILV